MPEDFRPLPDETKKTDQESKIIAPNQAIITPDHLYQALKMNPNMSIGDLLDWIKNILNGQSK